MTAFVIKSALCMVLFFGLYWLFLRKEKLFIFNRYYLIFSVVLSLTVPFISLPVSISYPVRIIYENSPVFREFLPGNSSEEAPQPEETMTLQPGILPSADFHAEVHTGQSVRLADVSDNTTDPGKIILIIYLSGVLLMMIRFLRNIFQVSRMLRKSEKIEYEWYQLALLDDKVSPFSFLRTIFLNKQDYAENRVGAGVLSHELEHIRQAHSFDIIFFEILHLAFWFNPVLFLYKRAARINHEYLADEAVVNGIPDIQIYANELVNFISHRLTIPYTSGFSPSMIKLRLLMLNTKTSRKGKIHRILLTLFMSVILIGSLSMKPELKDNENKRRRIAASNKDIIIRDVFFRNKDFNPLLSLVVLNGKELGPGDSITVEIRNIKTLNLLTDRKAKRKYGKDGKDGVLEISTYDTDKSSAPDTSYFKPLYTINGAVPDKGISIPVSNLYSVSMWTYPVFPNQDPGKRWRLMEIMTRDYYKIGGSVIRSNGDAIGDVKVSSTDNPSETRTGDDGRFMLSDINPGSVIELTAPGYSPARFEVPKGIFNTDLAITLYRINEPDSDLIISDTGKKIIDFSGRWIFNPELSKSRFPSNYERIYDIRQFDSDSILIQMTAKGVDGKVYNDKMKFVFNTIKIDTGRNKIYKFVTSCLVAADGQSFSVSNGSKSIIASFRKYKRVENYSLSEDGKQLIVREYSQSDPAFRNNFEIPPLVFDKE